VACPKATGSAHIEENLPRSLAEVYFSHYKDPCGYGRFRGDYLPMAPLFKEAGERNLSDVPRSNFSAVHRFLDRLPLQAQEVLNSRLLLDLKRCRMRLQTPTSYVCFAKARPPPVISSLKPHRSTPKIPPLP